MRKLVALTISIVMLVFCMTMPAQAYDLGKALGIGEEKTLLLDAEVKAARPFDANYTVAYDIETLNITAKEHEWFLSTEIGLKIYDLVRPYVILETVTGIYAQRLYGVEILYPISGVDVGVWGAYISRENYGVAKDRYGMAGFVARF